MPRDYLMHQIESFAYALARVLGLVSLRQYDEAIEIINQTTGKLYRLDLQSLLLLSPEDLTAHLRASFPFEEVGGKIVESAMLLKQAAHIHSLAGRQEESIRAYLSALGFLLHSVIETPSREPAALIDEIAGELVGEAIPIERAIQLMEHYEGRGRFATAEDILFGVLEHHPRSVRIFMAGLEFYDRLRSRNDAVLAAGNLPREEMEAGLAELRARSVRR